jgi:hypothetical protein
MLIACEPIKLAPIDSGHAPPLPVGARELFDLTPPELIDAIVTEDGTYHTVEMAALVERTPFLRKGYDLLRADP